MEKELTNLKSDAKMKERKEKEKLAISLIMELDAEQLEKFLKECYLWKAMNRC